MRIALDVREGGDLHAPRLRDAPEIIAAEIDEHHVFGVLLHIRDEIALVGRVLFGRRAARTRPRDRACRARAPLKLDELFGRRTDQRAVSDLHVDVVRRGVHHAERPVERDGIGVRLLGELLGRHDLDAFAVQDVLLALRHDVGEIVCGHLRCERPRRRAAAWTRPHTLAQEEARVHFVDAFASAAVGIRIGAVHAHDHRDRAAQVVEHEHRIREHERGGGGIRFRRKLHARLEG